MLQGIDEGTEQQFTVAQQHSIKEWCQGFRVGGENRSATKHDRIVIATVFGPDRNVLVLQQLRKDRSIQLPAQRESEQIAASWQRISLVGEQPAHVHIAALGQGRPHDLITQAGNANGIRAGKGQNGLESIVVRLGRIEQQRFLIQLRSPGEDCGGVGGLNGRR